MRGDGVRLPSRFPVGTRYVIEGHEGRIRLRYLEFPDGRKMSLGGSNPDEGKDRPQEK